MKSLVNWFHLFFFSGRLNVHLHFYTRKTFRDSEMHCMSQVCVVVFK